MSVVKLIDSNTSELVSYESTTTWYNGTPMDDSKVDNVIYRKSGGVYYKRAFTGPVNVKWFGAKGDGVTDDTATVRKAVAVCEKLKATLFLPGGTYILSGSITILTGYFTIQGEEDMSSNVTYTGDNEAFVIGSRVTPPLFGTAAYYINFKNFRIIGGNKVGTSAIKATFRYCYLQNIEIRHFDTGLDFMFSWTNKYNNVRIIGRSDPDPLILTKYGVGVKTGVQCNSNSYINCNIADCDTGVLFTGGSSQNFNFVGSQIENCTTYAFKVSNANQLRGVTITGNYFENPGIFFSAIDNSGISGLVLQGNHTATNGNGLAIELASASGRVVGVIVANTFTRVNNTVEGQFVSLTSNAYVNLQNNQGYQSDASFTPIEILTTSTLTSSNSRFFTRTDTAYPHRFDTIGTVKASKGFIVGTDLPFAYTEGLLIWDSNAKLLHQYTGPDATGSSYIQTSLSGPTASRPTVRRQGQQYFDTTLSKPIYWSGTAWVDATGTEV